jgi:hypothetical protein
MWMFFVVNQNQSRIYIPMYFLTKKIVRNFSIQFSSEFSLYQFVPDDQIDPTAMVTRLCEFSPIGRLFTIGSF